MDLLSDLNEPQRRAVTHMDGPLLVLAGAGSGKTRVITRRVAWLVRQGVAPWQVLAITFTNKAAGEMRERVEALGVPRGATVGTFHAVCARLLREFAAEANLPGDFSIYDRDDQLRLTKQAMENAGVAGTSLTPGAVHGTISNAKNDLMTPEQYAEKAGNFYERRVARVFAEYRRLLASNQALDFDDLLLRTAYLLRDRSDACEALGRRYRYVLIDEYQDTNHAQYIIAHGIALEHENICATGDPDQSIYAWRGADLRNILEFEKDYPNANVVRLEENYRSTAPILASASRLIAHNRNRRPKDLWTRKEGGADVRVLYCDDERAEAARIGERIARFRSGGGEWQDAAVFYRVNSLSRVLEETFFRAGIPYRVARGVAFFNRKEVKDLLAYLRLAVNPADDLSCDRVVNTPTRGIGATSQDRLKAYAASAGVSLLEACRQAERAGLTGAATGRARGFAGIIDELSAGAADRPVKEISEDAYRKSGLEASLAGDEEEKRQARSNLEELISTAAEFDARMGGSLADYLYQVSLVSDADHYVGGEGAVTLMTLHAAKGLEFPAVFIVGCEDGLLPFQRDGGVMGGGREADIEEERRLAFVGMTRAKRELTLTCARQRMIRGRTERRSGSMFLGEIEGEGVLSENLTTPTAAPRRPGRAGGFYSDSTERASIESMVDEQALRRAESGEHPPPPEYEHLREGCRVQHPKFGAGTVRRLRQPWPETRAEVDFDRLGPKTLVLSKANIELL